MYGDRMLVECYGGYYNEMLHVFSSKLNFATTVRYYAHLGDILKSVPLVFKLYSTLQHLEYTVLPPGNNCQLSKNAQSTSESYVSFAEEN